MGIIDVYTEFDMFKVKVPIIFLGTVGPSLRKRDVTLLMGVVRVSFMM